MDKLKRQAVYLGLGSNLGNRWANLRQALSRLRITPKLELKQVSSVYESEPLDFPDQRDFLNGVCQVLTDLLPLQVLGILLGIETEMGRKRAVPKGPRIIDLDILLYSDSVIDEEDLVVPHPRLHQRKFVLLPLVEICPDLIHPVLGKRMDRLLRELVDNTRVELVGRLDNGLRVASSERAASR